MRIPENQYDEQQVAQLAFQEFANKASVSIKDDPEVVKAWELLLEKGGGELSILGTPYWKDSLAVAEIILDQIGLGAQSVCAGFLYGLVLNEKVTDKELKERLSPAVMNLLIGLRKVAGIRTDRTAFQPENFIKLILTVADDVRVALIRLADRLHHLRHANLYTPSGQQLLASECAYLYAPVAHRLGLYHIKTELEDHAMRILEPQAYASILQKVSESKTKQKALIEDFISPVEKELLRHGFDFEIKWRTKSIPSIWRKMKTQQVDYEQVYDVFAVRIVLNNTLESEKADAWKVYSIITDIYPPNPERLRDWISAPKPSGYESLHTTVFGPGKRWFEVQIRTSRMDEIAEKGHASHWSYKDKGADVSSAAWLKSIRELLEKPSPDALRNSQKAKADLYSDKIFIFTPDGDLRKLPAGSTVLDFAYEIHTRIGNQCVGGKVNGKNATIKHKLSSGDSVEILTSKNQQPKGDWLGYVVSPKAKTRIKRALKEKVLKEAALGKEMVERKFRNWKIPYTDDQIYKIVKYYGYKDSLEFYAAIASGSLDLLDVKTFIKFDTQGLPEKSISHIQSTTDAGMRSAELETQEDIIEIDEALERVNYSLAPCCNPIFGDDIFGFITVSKGITIHRINCPNAADLLNKYPYRVVKVSWRKSSGLTSYQATIRVSGMDELGIVNQISEIISNDMKVNMRSISFESSTGRFEGQITMNVFDTQHLEAVIRKIQKIKGVNRVVRSEGM